MARDIQFIPQTVLTPYAKLFYQYTFNLMAFWSLSQNFRLKREGTADIPLETVWSAPEKMFAQTDANFNGQPPLPIISIYLLDVELRPEVDRPRETKEIRTYQGKTYAVSQPKPFFLNYQCTLWASHNADADEIITQLYHHSNQNMIWLKFMQDPGISPKHRNGIGNYMPMWIENIADNSDFEVGDTASRVIRKDITLKVEAYLPYPVEEIQTIGSIGVGLKAQGVLDKTFFLNYGSTRNFDQPPETLTYTVSETNDSQVNYLHSAGTFNFD